MRFFAALSLAGLALANPVKDLEARQLNPSQSSTCAASYTRSCTSGTSMSAARTWCSSLGYGTTWSTVRKTATINRTIMMTMTSTTSTSTITAARVTNTATSVRTTMTTQTTTMTSSRTFTETQVINTFGVIDACPNYTPENTTPNPEVPGVDSTTTSATTTTAAASSSCALVRPAGPSGDCGGVLGYRSREQDGNGVTLSQGTLTDPASIASLEGCALACRKFDDSGALGSVSGVPGCISVYWAPNRSCELYRGHLGDTRWMPGTGANARYQAAFMSCFTCSAGTAQAQSTTTTTRTTTTTPALTTTTPAITTTTTSPRGLGCPNPTPTSFTRAGVVRYYEWCMAYMSPDSVNIRPQNKEGCEAACIGNCIAFNYGGDDNNCRTLTAPVTSVTAPHYGWQAYSLVSKSTISPAGTTTASAANTVPTTCALATASASNPALCNVGGNLWSAHDGTGPLKQKYLANVPSIEACAAECRKLDASGEIGESGMPGCKSVWYRWDRTCELQRKDLNASHYEPSFMGNVANMDCFSCAAVGASSSSTTTTTRTTTTSLTTTTRASTTTTAAPTTTASTTVAGAGAGSCALTAPNPPNPSVCYEQYTGVSNNPAQQQRRLTDSASRASADACAKACKSFDQAGSNGESGAPGCKAFAWDSSSCTLYRSDVSQLALSFGAGPRFLDLACFECSGFTSATTTTTSAASTASVVASGCAFDAPSAPDPSQCSELKGYPGEYGNDQILLTDSVSRRSVNDCAKACKSYDQGGFIGQSGRAGCKSFSFSQDQHCILWQVPRAQLRVSPQWSGPEVIDMSCYRCAGVATPTSPPPAQVTNGQYSSCDGSSLLEFNNGATYQVFCGSIRAPSIITTLTRYSLEDCAAACTDDSNCTAVTWLQNGPAANRCQLKHPAGSESGSAYTLEGRDSTFPADTIIVSAGRVKRYDNDPYPYASMAWKRDETLSPRQGQYPQPGCLKATNAAQTTAACNCVIPSSSVTLTQTVSSIVTNARTISTTLNLVATTTMTPTTTITTTRVTTLFRTKAITAWKTFSTTATVESITSYSLATTPSAFYIVDGDMAFAEWPADADEIHYHIQYDWDQSDDEYAPTVFSLDNDKLKVADLSNMDGLAEGYPVVGQSDGAGMQLMALSDGGGLESPTCSIEPTKEGQCPIICRMGEMEVNTRNGDGLWTLVPKGGEEGFTNYVLAADVSVEDEGGDGGSGDGGEPAMGAWK